MVSARDTVYFPTLYNAHNAVLYTFLHATCHSTYCLTYYVVLHAILPARLDKYSQ